MKKMKKMFFKVKSIYPSAVWDRQYVIKWEDNEINSYIQSPKFEAWSRKWRGVETVDDSMVKFKSCFVACLPHGLQQKVRRMVLEALRAEGINGEELRELTAEAMESRLSDLEDVVNLKLK